MSDLLTTTVNSGAVRRALGRNQWAGSMMFGPDGWVMDRKDRSARIIVTCAPHEDPLGVTAEYVHASISRPDQLPTYEDLKALHLAVWGGKGWAYQVFAPTSHHVNIHEFALHLWGRADGSAVLPEFGADGSI